MKKVIFGVITSCSILGFNGTEQQDEMPLAIPSVTSFQDIESSDFIEGSYSSELSLGSKWVSIEDPEVISTVTDYGEYSVDIEIYRLTGTYYYLVDIVHLMDPSERSEFIVSEVSFNHYPTASKETERAYPVYVYPFTVENVSSNTIQTHATYTGYDCSLKLPDDAPTAGSDVDCKTKTAIHERVDRFDYGVIEEYDPNTLDSNVKGIYHEYYYDWNANLQGYNEVKTEQRQLVLLDAHYDDYYSNMFSINIDIEVGFAKDGTFSNKHDTASIYRNIQIPRPW